MARKSKSKTKAESAKRKSENPKLGHRPSSYKAEFARLAFQHTLIGATDKDLAALFDVDVATINRWKLKFPAFCESLKRGKAKADAKVAEMLYKRATGYDHEAVKIFCQDGETFEHRYQEHYPPDTTAQIFWLKNRQPHLFRQNPEVAVTVNNDVKVDTSKPPEQWGAKEIEAELRRMGCEPITTKTPLNGNRNGNHKPG